MHTPLHFQPFRFDPVTAQLWNADREIKLTRKAAAVLALLVSRAGRPVTKNELFDTVWSGAVVSDDALTTCIQELRKALGDDARQPRFIETRHRSGYQFIAAIASPVQSLDAPHDPNSIAVLPFTDMSAERDQDFFCEGLAEELIDALTHVDGLRVVARTSSFHFRSGDVRETGRALGVESLLEGSVRKSGNVLRITVQLIDVRSGFHKWSERFERELGDVFAIQDEIAENVAAILRGSALSVRERRGVQRRHTASETYEQYLRGRQSLHRMRIVELTQSRQSFERAIALDASYAPAWAGLATAHGTLYEWFGASDEDLKRADAASEKALELAPDSADAHVARGFVLSLHRRYAEAEPHFENAIRINSHLFDAFYLFGRMCFARGQIERSAGLFLQASEVRREDFQSLELAAQSFGMIGRKEQERTLRGESIVRAERILALNPLDGRTLSLGGATLAHDGQVERALAWTRRSLELYPEDMGSLLNATCVYCRLGMKEEALQCFEQAANYGWGRRDWIEKDPDYDVIRDDPRFQKAMAKLK